MLKKFTKFFMALGLASTTAVAAMNNDMMMMNNNDMMMDRMFCLGINPLRGANAVLAVNANYHFNEMYSLVLNADIDFGTAFANASPTRSPIYLSNVDLELRIAPMMDNMMNGLYFSLGAGVDFYGFKNEIKRYDSSDNPVFEHTLSDKLSGKTDTEDGKQSAKNGTLQIALYGFAGVGHELFFNSFVSLTNEIRFEHDIADFLAPAVDKTSNEVTAFNSANFPSSRREGINIRFDVLRFNFRVA